MNKKQTLNTTLLLFGLAVMLLGACEDPIDLDSTFENPEPVIDAWITNSSEAQTIKLSFTQDFFANSLPPAMTGATVTVCQTSIGEDCFTFEEGTPGEYVWQPNAGETIGEIGEVFELRVINGDETYTSTTEMFRVAPIDSISIQFEEGQLGLDEGNYAQVYARDLPGVGDRYLIRSTINDTLLNRIEELNIAYDAAFDGGTATDGIYFILPIRFGINKQSNSGAIESLNAGDSIRVDVWSISPIAFDFLSNAEEQIQNGDAQLFSVPVVSSKGNVINAENNEAVIGIFNVAAESTARKTVE